MFTSKIKNNDQAVNFVKWLIFGKWMLISNNFLQLTAFILIHAWSKFEVIRIIIRRFVGIFSLIPDNFTFMYQTNLLYPPLTSLEPKYHLKCAIFPYMHVTYTIGKSKDSSTCTKKIRNIGKLARLPPPPT